MESKFMKERNELQKNFEELMPETAENFNQIMKITFSDGAISSKMKELIALGISVTVKCEPCMEYHIESALNKGATKEEILEAINVGYEMGVGKLVPPIRKIIKKKFK